MRLSVPSCGRLLAAIGLATTLSLAGLSAQAAPHDHQYEHAELPAMAADAAQARQQASDHTQALMALHKQWTKAQGHEKSRALEQLIAKAEERQSFLAELIKTNPAEVLRVAIPDERQQGMPAEVLEFLEQKLELEGEFEAVYEDYEDGSHKLRHFLKTPFGERFELHFAGRNQPQQLTGAKVRVNGLLVAQMTEGTDISGTMALDADNDGILTLDADGANSGTGTPTLTNTFGEQSTLVMLVNFQDNTAQPQTVQEVSDVVFGTTNAYIQEASHNQTWLAGTVTPWMTLPLSSTSCDHYAIRTEAFAAAQAQGFNLADYKRHVYVFPKISCGWGGKGTVGGWPSSAWINGKAGLYVVGHELGHNLGLKHADALECYTTSIGSNCSAVAYGDYIDMMGSGPSGHYNAIQKDRLGWLTSQANEVQVVDNSGQYQLSPYAETPNGSLKALKILKEYDASTGNRLWYYLEFRQPIGFDNFLTNENILNGIVIRQSHEKTGTSYMLDTTPGTSLSSTMDMRDAALQVGQSFIDSDLGLTITPSWINSTGATVDISMGPQVCMPEPLELSVPSNESSWVSAGTTVDYPISVSNKDNIECDVRSADLSVSVPPGWTYQIDTGDLQLEPGETALAVLSVTSATTASDGFYSIDIVAASEDSANATVTYVIDTPNTNSPPIADDDQVSTDEGSEVSFNVLNNDYDPDGDNIVVVSISQAINGTVTTKADGTLYYKPNDGFYGYDSFSYEISDNKGGFAQAAVTIEIKEKLVINNAPIATEDQVVIDSKSAVTIQVLNNDWDPDDDSITVISSEDGAKGRVVVNGDGTLTYTPNKNFKDSDSFNYTITDGDLTATSTVHISMQQSGEPGGNSKGNGRNK